MRSIKMDIRQFAVPCPLVGSIETHSGYAAPPLSGQEIHQMIQRKLERENPDFVSEKPFSLKIELDEFNLTINGRADGFIEDPAEIIEIKTAFDVQELYKKLLADFNHPYVWQLRTYGYVYFKDTGIVPDLTMRLVSARNIKKSVDISVDLDLEEYERWMDLRLKVVAEEVKIKEKILKKRKILADTLAFPFSSPRPGQMELIENVSEHFENETPLLIQAPTGLGKTAGILYPSMKEAFARGQKVVYVTPKNTQHLVAENAVDLMVDQGAKVKRLTLTGKSKMCLKDEPICNPRYCEYAKDYYKKLDENSLVEKLGKQKSLSSKKLKKMGEEFQVCPFELSLEGIDHADVVIGDYNYVFSPRSLIGRLSAPMLEMDESPNLVIDEAHNLPSRAQDYFSPQISMREIYDYKSRFNILDPDFVEEARDFADELIALISLYREGADTKKIVIDPAPFLDLEKKVRDFTISYLENDIEIKPEDPLLRFTNYCTDFVSGLELNGPEFFQTYQRYQDNETLKVTCSDASEQLKLAYKEFKNTAAFSATLKPFQYYQELLGLPSTKTKTIEFSSPFKKENRKILMIPQISTKYKDRPGSIPKICEVIQKITNLKAGNYIALFPSFDFMAKVADKLSLPNFQILVQQKKMTPKLTESYLETLRENSAPTLLLGVQGGIFSEGVDYPGDMLIGAFIVGPALPTFDFEREQIKEYYGKRYGEENAFDYAYVHPAMARAIQSAGRVIRTETDRGIIVLIDSRFLEESYSESMPTEWFEQSPRELLSTQILKDLKDFWESI